MVVKGRGSSLLGRLWLQELQLDWKQVYNVHNLTTSDGFMSQHKKLFGDDLGKLQDHQVHAAIEPEAQPKFCKARPVPFAHKAKVTAENNRLVQEGVLERVTFSKWATPIVPVLKESGKIRLCGDYKATVNQVVVPGIYPLPRVEELFEKLQVVKHLLS